MVIPDGAIEALLFLLLWGLSLIASVVMLAFKENRKRTSVKGWIAGLNIAAALLTIGYFTLQDIQKKRFWSMDADYAALPKTFDGRSFYVADVEQTTRAITGCDGYYDCFPAIAALIEAGLVDFVETGTDPVVRWTLAVQDPACVDPVDQFDIFGQARFFRPAFGVCITGEAVAAPTADHHVITERLRQPWPSDWYYSHVTLVRQSDGAVMDAIDGGTGAPRYGFIDEQGPRRTDGPLWQMFEAVNGRIDPRDKDAILGVLRRYGLNEKLLAAALENPSTGQRQRSFWIACLREAEAQMTTQGRAAIAEVLSRNHPFGGEDTFRYPQDCPAWAR